MNKSAKTAAHDVKKNLREHMNARRRDLPAAEAQHLAHTAQQALMNEAAWSQAHQVGLYVAARGEMGTALLLAAAWSAGKQVLLPRCRPRQPGYMDFVHCARVEDLRPGFWGILEPRPDMVALPWESDAVQGRNALCPDVLIIPGVAFDRQGNRLGYGGGYYDRALSHPALAGATCLGLAYSWQVVEHVPVELWDCPVQGLCTEEGVQWL